VALCAVYFICHHRRLVATYTAFAQPTREKLVDYLRNNVPPNAVIAADERLCLRDPEGRIRDDAPVSQKVIVKEQVGEFGTVDELIRQGVTYVAAHNLSSEPLFMGRSKDGKGVPATQPVRKRHQHTQEFYAELQKSSDMVWESPGGVSGYVTPGIRLYRLSPDKLKTKGAGDEP
jgi:hypothetical protein